MLKRKQTLKSPVELKKTRTSIGQAETPGRSSVAAQRQRAKEWGENDAKRLAQVDEDKGAKAKRSVTPSAKTPGKRSKIVYEEDPKDPEPEVRQPPRSTRKSVSSTASSVTEEPTPVPSTRNARKTPAKAKVVKAEESDEESVPVAAVKPTRKTPAKAKATTATTSGKTPLTTSRKAATKTQPATASASTTDNSLPLIPIPLTGPSPFVTPTVTPAKANRPTSASNSNTQATSAQAASSRNTRAALACSLTPEESYLIEETTRPRPRADSLSPPSAFLTNMVTLYIFIGGIAYYDPQLGFLLFLAVSILANLFVMSGLNEE